MSRFFPIKTHNTKKREYNISNEKEKYKKEIWCIFIVCGIATGLYWSQAFVKHGLSGFLRGLLTTQEVENLGGFSVVILYFKMLTVFLSPYVLNYIIQYKERKPLYILIVIFTFVSNIAYTRNILFYIALLDLFVYIYTHINFKSKISLKWVLYTSIGVVAFRFFSYTQNLFNKQYNVQGTFLGSVLPSPVVTAISYFTGPVVSTSVYYDQITDVPLLGYTFRNFLSLINNFGLFHIDTDTYMPQTWVYIPFKFNTTTIQLYIIKEGGWIWFIIFFFILGYIADSVFSSYLKSKSRYAMMLLVLVSLVLVTSIRSYILTRLDMFIYCFLLFFLYFSRKFAVVFSHKGVY